MIYTIIAAVVAGIAGYRIGFDRGWNGSALASVCAQEKFLNDIADVLQEDERNTLNVLMMKGTNILAFKKLQKMSEEFKN